MGFGERLMVRGWSAATPPRRLGRPTPTNALTLAADGKAFSGFFDSHSLQRFQVLFDLGPLQLLAGWLQAVVQLFSQHQREKAAKHMTPVGAVPLVKDGWVIRSDVTGRTAVSGGGRPFVIRLNRTEFEKFRQSAMPLWEKFAAKSPACDEMVKIIRADLEQWTATRPEAKKWEERWLAK